MSERVTSRVLSAVLASCLAAGPLAASAAAQESTSAAPASELAALLAERKLDAIAAAHPTRPDEFVAALYFPGQLLVVWARYEAPSIMKEKIARGEYRDVYIDLNSASIPESKVLITDLGADGLKARRDNNEPFDTQDAAGKGFSFDGNWREDRMSEEDYMKVFAQADQAYATALRTLLAGVKRGS